MRTIGFELEVSGTPHYRFTDRYVENGYTSYPQYKDYYVTNVYRELRQFKINNRRYEVQNDGSIDGIEVASPVITLGELSDVGELLRLLRGLDYGSDGKCGLHVHIEANDDVRGDYNFVKSFWETKREYVLKRFPIWKSRSYYCGGVDGRMERYNTKYLPVHIHPEYPTIEFRLFNSVLNPRYICNAIRMAYQMVEEMEQTHCG